MQSLLHTLSHDMFFLSVPLVEKILRPVVVYLFLVVFLRIFGKRELAQLNPFDLVVLLSLSNTVQNAMIGDDNSVSGGVVGAFSLLAINWLLAWVLYRAPKATVLLSGSAATLVRDGVVDETEMKKQSLTHEDLVSVLNKNRRMCRRACWSRMGRFMWRGRSRRVMRWSERRSCGRCRS
jgi:uncharacterized membrane protein YcaP (DUF421 family)